MKSLRQAINRKCRDCIADPANAGSAAQQVAACTSIDCPLWAVRPVRKGLRFGEPIRVELGRHLTPAQIDRWEAHPHEPPPLAGGPPGRG